jgi:hypothetical protein
MDLLRGREESSTERGCLGRNASADPAGRVRGTLIGDAEEASFSASGLAKVGERNAAPDVNALFVRKSRLRIVGLQKAAARQKEEDAPSIFLFLVVGSTALRRRDADPVAAYAARWRCW